MKTRKYKGEPDALQALLSFVANEEVAYPQAIPENSQVEEYLERLDALKKAWLDAGCPGVADRLPDEAPLGFRRVRIAVVQRGKKWAAAGWEGKERDMVECAEAEVDDDLPKSKSKEGIVLSRLDWVEADVPLPLESTTVEGVAL
jgi:hypothetical protein